MSLQAIKYSRGSLSILNQLNLPHESTYVPIRTTADAFTAIRTMLVRGAPAIAIVAALSLAVELLSLPLPASTDASSAVVDGEGVKELIAEKLDFLITSRPTAVNLFDAAGKLKAAVGAPGSRQEVIEAYIAAAEKMLVDDVRDNTNIGAFGADWILQNATPAARNVAILTHCNTGSLATAGYGTALGVIRSLHASGRLSHAYCTETRPYNQGSRLTAYELVHESIPATLITDSMAAVVMRDKGVAAVVVGADRVAANGDTANKVGTYQLAVLARHHGVRFVVAAPTTSVDLGTKNGAGIVIEERPKSEVVVITGPRVLPGGGVDLGHIETVSTAARGIGVFNPSFDVTPKTLIDAIVMENGVAVKDEDGNFDLLRLFQGRA